MYHSYETAFIITSAPYILEYPILIKNFEGMTFFVYIVYEL